MRTLRSLQREEARLRKRHTDQFYNNKWQEMDTTRRKLVLVLNAISDLSGQPNLKPFKR